MRSRLARPVARRLNILIRVVVTAAAVAILARSISFADVGQLMRSLDPRWLVAALALFLAAQIVSSLRCLYIARTLGAALSLSRSIEAHFVGLLFNQVLPTSLGGDVVKAGMLSKDLGLNVAIRATILDRASGFLFLLLSVAVLLPAYLWTLRSAAMTACLGVGAVGTLAAVVVASRYSEWLSRKLARVPGAVLVLSLLQDVYRFRYPRPFAEQFWTSLVVHVNGVMSYALIGHALGIEFAWLNYFLIVPLIFLVALVPISLAGWGTREIGAVWLFGMLDLSPEQAVTMSVLFGILIVVASLPGLGYLLLGARAAKPGVTDADGAPR
jgi:uncharacterized membrane protein YbhN (UPF0104 family)